jgi:hypothetical protein
MSKKRLMFVFVVVLIGLLLIGCGGSNGLNKRTVTGNWNVIDDINTVYMFKSDGSLTIQVNGADFATAIWYIENGSLCTDEMSILGADPPGFRSCINTKIEDDVLIQYDLSTSEWVHKLRKVGK